MAIGRGIGEAGLVISSDKNLTAAGRAGAWLWSRAGPGLLQGHSTCGGWGVHGVSSQGSIQLGGRPPAALKLELQPGFDQLAAADRGGGGARGHGRRLSARRASPETRAAALAVLRQRLPDDQFWLDPGGLPNTDRAAQRLRRLNWVDWLGIHRDRRAVGHWRPALERPPRR